MASTGEADTECRSAQGSGYRPWLDGVRALALVAVLLQHTLPANHLGLGGAGVGLFFALSGYLITGMLADEHARTGRIALGAFYVRRAARLAPALILMVAVVSLTLAALGEPGPIEWAVPALLYMGNYATVAHGGFLPIFGATWSLAIEEHFYLIWPVVLMIGLRRRPMVSVLRWTLVACVVDVAWRWLLVSAGAPERLPFVGTVERADALLYGCAAALAVRLGWRPNGWVTTVGGGLVVAVAVTPSLQGAVVDQAVLAIGGAVFVAGLDMMRAEWIRGVLSTRPVVTLGVLSYGIYLWHVPAINLLPLTTALAVSLLVPCASYLWVEQPIRRWARGLCDTERVDPDRRRERAGVAADADLVGRQER